MSIKLSKENKKLKDKYLYKCKYVGCNKSFPMKGGLLMHQDSKYSHVYITTNRNLWYTLSHEFIVKNVNCVDTYKILQDFIDNDVWKSEEEYVNTNNFKIKIKSYIYCEILNHFSNLKYISPNNIYFQNINYTACSYNSVFMTTFNWLNIHNNIHRSQYITIMEILYGHINIIIKNIDNYMVTIVDKLIMFQSPDKDAHNYHNIREIIKSYIHEITDYSIYEKMY